MILDLPEANRLLANSLAHLGFTLGFTTARLVGVQRHRYRPLQPWNWGGPPLRPGKAAPILQDLQA